MKRTLIFALMAACSLAQAEVYLRSAHAVPNAPKMDIYLDDQAIAQNVDFMTVTPFLKVTSAIHTLRLTPAGQKDQTLLSMDTDLSDDFAYTLEIIAAGKDLDVNLVAYNFTDTEEGKANLSVQDMVPGDEHLDLNWNAEKRFEAMAFMDTWDTKLDPGKGKLVFLASATGNTLAETPEVKVESGKFYSLLAFPTGSGKIHLTFLEDTLK